MMRPKAWLIFSLYVSPNTTWSTYWFIFVCHRSPFSSGLVSNLSVSVQSTVTDRPITANKRDKNVNTPQCEYFRSNWSQEGCKSVRIGGADPSVRPNKQAPWLVWFIGKGRVDYLFKYKAWCSSVPSPQIKTTSVSQTAALVHMFLHSRSGRLSVLTMCINPPLKIVLTNLPFLFE